MAMFLFNKRATELNKKLKADSAGLAVQGGDQIANNAVLALREFGVFDIQYNSKQLSKKLFTEADLVVTMTERQKQALPKSKKVVSFLDILGQDILDPFGQDEQAYFNCAQQIESGFDKIFEMLS